MTASPTALGVAAPPGRVRWLICGLLFFAVVLSYVDRLVISVLKPDLGHRYHWTETGYADLVFYFQLAYGLAYLVSGRVIDRIGARRGYALAAAIWGAGQMLHAAFTSTAGMVWARLVLAVGEAATFPAAIAATNEWFPKRERALAIGIFNAGSNIGAIITPLLVPFIALRFGWRMAFIVTGVLTLVWIAAWLIVYRRPSAFKRLTAEERSWIEADPPEPAQPVSWGRLLKTRQAWAYIAGRFLIDPVWWTYLYWLPDFFNRQFHAKITEYGLPLVVIFILADAGSVAGGWLSSRFLHLGWRLRDARKGAMLISAALPLPILFATGAPDQGTAVLLIGLACAGHQGFSANLYTLPGDLFPRWASGAVVGLGGCAGALGGMVMSKSAGLILQTLGSFTPIFAFGAFAYFIAFAVMHVIAPTYEPAILAPQDVRRVADQGR